MNKQKRNWLLDAALLIGFLVSFFTDWTGISWHQWLGAVLAAGCLYHLLLHWKWVESITRRLFCSVNRQCRYFYLVDFTLLLGFLTILITGLGISTWFNLDLVSYPVWKNLHIYSSLISLGLLLLKIELHWRWIVRTAQRHLGLWKTDQTRGIAGPQVLAASGKSLERREFIQLMGIVSLGSLLSISNLFDIFQEDSSFSEGDQQTSLSTEDPDSISCQVLCDRGCSYPGECRRYVDTNGNGICDLTECSIPRDDIQQQTEEAVGPKGTPSSNETESCTAECDRGCTYPGECGQYIDLNGNGICDLSECAELALAADQAEINPRETPSTEQAACQILCNRSCAYPGECGSYTDVNGNGLCDLGECLASNTGLPVSESITIGHGKGRRRRGN